MSSYIKGKETMQPGKGVAMDVHLAEVMMYFCLAFTKLIIYIACP